MDAATIEAARRGSSKAAAELIRALQDAWYRYCLSQLGQADLAREATQETAMRFLRQIGNFRGESQLMTWAIGIALNVVREMRRSNKIVDGRRLWQGRSAAAIPDEAAAGHEQAEALHAALAELPERQREAVALRFLEELSVEQTAQAMQCAEGTVKATVHQALRSMRLKLKHWV